MRSDDAFYLRRINSGPASSTARSVTVIVHPVDAATGQPRYLPPAEARRVGARDLLDRRRPHL
ncbi:hypothetical protein Rwratislav_00725 [Rhodococcus wratislaviensis IFP 2016]|nr:hypothetical protein Rwratislav_00725 [Rhodococcus wratislaviensis IFP 2016]